MIDKAINIIESLLLLIVVVSLSFFAISIFYMLFILIFDVVVGVNLNTEYVQPFLKELIFG